MQYPSVATFYNKFPSAWLILTKPDKQLKDMIHFDFVVDLPIPKRVAIKFFNGYIFHNF